MSAADREKWNARYAAAADEAPREPSRVLVELAEYLPAAGRALDIAGGAGRHSLWLARRGLEVTLLDVSAEGLAIARRRAATEGLRLETLERDVEAAGLPAGPWDLILCVCYLCRHLFDQFPEVLAPGGTLVVIQPTKKNLERHPKPPAGYLFEEGELMRGIRGLDLVHTAEGWLADERHDAVLVARKRA